MSHYVAATVSALCLCVALLILTDYLRSIRHYQWERKSLKLIGTVGLFAYTISLGINTASQILYITNASNEELFFILYEIKTVFFVIGECFTYFMFMFRLHFVFEGTPFQEKPCMLKMLLAAVVIFILFQIQFMILVTLNHTATVSITAFSIARDIQIILNDLIDLFISIVLFYVFMSKLYKISNAINKYKAINHRNTTSNKKQGDHNDTILFNITAKLSVLAFLPLLVTPINFIVECLLALLSGSFGAPDSLWLTSPIAVYLHLFDCMVSMWCSYMTYTIENAQLWYGRICRSCDHRCKVLVSNKNSVTGDSYFELSDTTTFMSNTNRPNNSNM